MTAIRTILLSAFIAATLQPNATHADAGHDHAAPAATGVVGVNVSRVEAQSDLFEIVAVVEGGAMKIFLDRYATNDPVVDAKIDIEGGPLKGAAQATPDGTFSFANAALAQPGQFPVTFTIAAGSDNDLLTGDLVIADLAAGHAPASTDPIHRRWWWVAGALLLLVGIAVVGWSRRKRVKGIER